MGDLSAAGSVTVTQPYVASCVEDAPGWQASLQLTLNRTERGTRLKHNRHSGPLYVQKPFYPEGPELAHIYLLHPPGGIVMGDALETQVVAEAGAAVLLTTPGANRFYGRGVARYSGRHSGKQPGSSNAAEPIQTQINRLQVAAGASLEWLPLETLIYDGAEARMQTEVSLASGARYLGWEFNCLGLPASKQAFTQGGFRQSLKISLDGRPLLIDRLTIENGGEQLRLGLAGMRGHTVSGTFIAGPFPEAADLKSVLENIRETVAKIGAAERVAVTAVGSLLVARYLGDSAMQGRGDFYPLWQQCRETLLNRKVCAPRIWAT